MMNAESSPSNIKKKIGCPLLPFLFNTGKKGLAKSNEQGKEIKGIQIGMKEVKLFQFADNVILYIFKNPMKPTERG